MTRVYSYGARAPVQGGDVLGRQLRLAHEYYNELIAIERRRRAEYSLCCSMQSEELQDITAMIEACQGTRIDARAEAAQERVKERSRRASNDEIVATIEQANEDLAWLWGERQALVAKEKKRDPGFVEKISNLDAAAHAAAKDMRGVYSGKGLYWGTYLTIETSIEQAKKSHQPPQFRRGGGVSGQIAVQLQKGLSVEQAFGGDQRLQIDPIALGTKGDGSKGEVWDAPRGQRRRLARVKARIRAGSEGRSPVWVEVPIVMHRPLPPGSSIKWARLTVRQVAGHLDYSLQLTVDEPPAKLVPVAPKTAVGIDIGWRWQDAIRVGYFYDGSGSHGAISLANDVVAAFDHARSLQSIRDRNFDQIKGALQGWLSASQDAPEWLREAARGLHQWRSQGRLASLLVGYWKDNERCPGWRTQRFQGDDEIYGAVEAWRKQDRHLWEWEVNERRKALARRAEAYKCWAAGIASKYSLVIIEDFDLRSMARQTPVEQNGEYDDLARAQRIVSAPSLMRSALLNACALRGVAVVREPCAGTTVTCHACKKETPWDAAKYLSHRCECGEVWDQDYNAAVNLYHAGVSHAPTMEERMKATAKRPGRWARRKAGKVDEAKCAATPERRAA